MFIVTKFAFDFSSEELNLVGQSRVGQYVVDAAIRPSNADSEVVELVMLLSESEDSKDGRAATVNISRLNGAVSPQYISSI